LRADLELTAGNLSQHLGVLESAGLITLEKGYSGKRPPHKGLISRIERTGTTPKS
jgi:DNA-binding transcriptional ArsR family regulator